MKKMIFRFSMVLCVAALLTACSERQDSFLRSDSGESTETSSVVSSTNAEPEISERDHAADWSAVTADGVNEELFLAQMDASALEYIAAELQTLVQEEYEAERANPEILLSQGWTRVFRSEHYQNVIAMGDSAMMPLYWIIYKSTDSGQYEYICAEALYELSGYDFANPDGTRKWSTSKELLALFNTEILKP